MNKFFNLSILFFMTSSLYAFTINDGYDMALKNDVDTQIRQNDLKTIEYDIDIAKSLNYPTVDLTGKVETSKRSNGQLTPKNSVNHSKTDEYEIKLKQPLYDGNDASNEKKIQKNRYKSAQYYFLESKNSLALKFVEAYIDMLKQKDALNLYMESYVASKDIYTKVTKKLLKGLGTKLEYEKAKGDFEENKVNLNIQRINYKNAYENLKFFIQKDFDTNELMKPVFTYDLPRNLQNAVEEAFIKHPSLLVAKSNVLVSKFEQQRDKKSFHPKVDLVSSYKVDNVAHKTADEYNEYKIGVEFSYNLYNGGKDVANNEKTLRNIKEKKHQVQKTKQEIENRLSLAWTSYTLNQDKLKSIKDYVYTKKMILNAMLQEFDLGFQDLSSVLEEHVKYINVKRDLISTTYDLLLARYRVLEAMGVLSDTLDEKVNGNILDKKDALVDKILTDAKYLYNLDKEVKEDQQEIIDQEPLKEEEIKELIPEDLLDSSIKKKDETLDNETLEKELPKKIEKTIEKVEEPKQAAPAKEEKQEVKLLIEEVIKKEEKDVPFKSKFLQASKDKYTINLALAYTEDGASKFLKRHKVQDRAFAIKFGKPKSMYKIMLGVFDTKLEAIEAINGLSDRLKRNRPRVEKIEIKQKLYKKYNSMDEK